MDWFKISVNIFDDEKIRYILSLPEGDKLFAIWLRLLAQARKTNDSGLIYIHRNIKLDAVTLHNIWNNVPMNSIKLALQIFENLDMISINDRGVIMIYNWEKYQNTDGLEKVQSQTRQRVARYREKQKKLALGMCNVTDNVTVTQNVTQRNAKVTQQNKNKNKNIYINIYTLFLYKFNKKLNRNFKTLPSKAQGQLNARRREGFKIWEIIRAAQRCALNSYHRDNPHLLTPEFITRGDKLEKYLHYKPKVDPINGHNIEQDWDNYDAAEEARKLASQ